MFLYGFDGFITGVAALVSFIPVLLLLAERMRNAGRYTMADLLTFRLSERPARTAAALGTLFVAAFYLVAQMIAAGALIEALAGLSFPVAVAITGLAMLAYVIFGGMLATTWVQIIKAVLLLSCVAVLAMWILGKFDFNPSHVLASAADRSGEGDAYLGPGLFFTKPLDSVSTGLAFALGTAGLPHILMRFYTVPSAKEARRSVVWAIWLIGIFYLFTLVLGYGASALVPGGATTIANAPGRTNSAAPLLAFHLGGEVLLGFISAVAFATILAVVAGLTITASASFAHDVYANVIKSGEVPPDAEVRVARITAVVIGVIAIAAGILARNQNIAFLVALAFAVAASANLPTILYSLFWKRFNTTGALWSIYGGLASCVLLIVFSPAVSGSPSAMIRDVDFHVFPLANPGLVSIPLSFLLGVIGTYVGGRQPVDEAKFSEMEVRSLTGAGSEKAISH